MGVAREQVHQAVLDQPQAALLRALPDPAVDGRRRHLDEHARLDELDEPLGMGLHLRIPFGVGEYRGDPLGPERGDLAQDRRNLRLFGP